MDSLDGSRLRQRLGQRWVSAAAATVVLPVALAPLLSPELRTWESLAAVSRISALVAVLAANVIFYITWRASGGPNGWLTLGLTALTVDAMTLAAATTSDANAIQTHAGWAALVQLATSTGVLALVIVAPRSTLRVDPLLAGVGLGLVATAVRTLLVATMPETHLSTVQLDVLLIATVALPLCAVAARGRQAGGAVVRWQITGACVLLTFGNAVAYLGDHHPFLTGVTVATNTLGAALILSVAVESTSSAIQDQRESLHRTRRELEAAQTSVRGDAARLHEIRSTIAGLTSAAHVLRREDALAEHQRRSVEAMMEAEMDRLQRLLHGQAAAEQATAVDLDATIEPVVVRHQLRGFPVRWEPSGERVHARPDDVAEVVSVLLDNAFQHAGGTRAWIYTRQIDGFVEIAVADAGPGIDQSVRPHIFEWGERSKRSSGSGIGLNVAQQLTVELGGYLRLADSPALGATFVLGLPAEDTQ